MVDIIYGIKHGSTVLLLLDNRNTHDSKQQKVNLVLVYLISSSSTPLQNTVNRHPYISNSAEFSTTTIIDNLISRILDVVEPHSCLYHVVHVDPRMLPEDDLQNDRDPVTFPTPDVVLCFPPHDHHTMWRLFFKYEMLVPLAFRKCNTTIYQFPTAHICTLIFSTVVSRCAQTFPCLS